MSRAGTGSVLAEALKDWQPGSVEMTRRVDPWPAAAFADLIGAPSPPPLSSGDPLPPMWHWFTLLDHPAQSELGADGHPAGGPFLPPVPGRRRMSPPVGCARTRRSRSARSCRAAQTSRACR